MTAVNSIEIPFEFVNICDAWHNGQASMLYAIASTGNLTLGTVRPPDCETDEEWYLRLWESLDSELVKLVHLVSTDYPDEEDLAVLDRFHHFAEKTVARLRG